LSISNVVFVLVELKKQQRLVLASKEVSPPLVEESESSASILPVSSTSTASNLYTYSAHRELSMRCGY